MVQKSKDAARDILAIQKLLKRHEKHLKRAAKTARQLHGLLDRCGEMYQDDLGVEIRSVIPKDPD